MMQWRQQRPEQVRRNDVDAVMNLPWVTPDLVIARLSRAMLRLIVHDFVHLQVTWWASRVARVAASAGGLMSVAINWQEPPLAAMMRTAEVITYPLPHPTSTHLQPAVLRMMPSIQFGCNRSS